MRKRKPILIIDDSSESEEILKIYKDNDIDFVKYNIKKFEESCCGDLPTTKAPALIAPEGIFKTRDLILEYVNYLKENQFQTKSNEESSSTTTIEKKINKY